MSNNCFRLSSTKLLVLLNLLLSPFFVNAAGVHQQIEVSWKIEEGNLGKENPVSKLVLHNTSNAPVLCNNWSVWFNFMRGVDVASVDKRFKIAHKNGDLYQLSFTDKNLVIPAKDSVEISFRTKSELPNFSDAPSGLYITYSDNESKAYPVKYHAIGGAYSLTESLNQLAEQYDNNRLANLGSPQPVIPSPASLQQGKGFYTINANTVLWADTVFKNEAAHLRAFLKADAGITLPFKSTKKTAGVKFLYSKLLAAEAYEIVINNKGILITAGTTTGAFYAVQTLKSLSPLKSRNINAKSIKILSVTIKDEPRFAYRGLMIDVARNFQSKESIKRIIDVMALYKLNTLHLHLNDDEGWRLEIPALPELTEIGSVRSGAYPNGKSLQPAYGSGAEANAKNYYTISDFKELLLYAQKNHICIIPELETPGHARAAIKSMEARYQKFMVSGNQNEAEKYLLHDRQDQSEYSSAQSWNDNVMNVAMPSVYSFISVVLDEIKGIYQSAGVPLNTVHLGGDEVPRGVWEQSPQIARLRDSLKLSSVHEVWPWYIQKIAALCKSKGLQMAGWEEMGMINKGKGMETNPTLAKTGIQLDVWNTLVGDGNEDLAYKLANAGYKVVFTSANNLYFDLAWKNTFNEPGHSWAGFTSIKKSYSFLPENYFLNIVNNNSGHKLPDDYFNKHERLTEFGKRNLIGIKGAIWTEKVQSRARLEYMLFPRVIALAERAWAAQPLWETGAEFNEGKFSQDYAQFMQKLGNDELKKLAVLNGGYLYRLPALGLRLYEDEFLCNTEYPGFDIFYTTDGTEPTLKSNKYSKPFLVDRTKTYKFNIITSTGRAAKTVTLNLIKP
ncbi:MAG: beta-N-acetylhexosaminidase [Sphingobacteriaceae bacterium]|nr:MAG: beta-N-acetylhexosaminidase [Sphingobacteriaceae bacterium]